MTVDPKNGTEGSARAQIAQTAPSRVRGDRVQLQQVILNLAMNAIEAMRADLNRPRELCIRTMQPNPVGVLVAVGDSGPGLPDGDREQLLAHGGRLGAANSGPRAVFQFELPAII